MGVKRSALEIRNLTKTYGAKVVLDGLNLQVDVGEKVALIGPSGSGKTTVLRILAGLEQPDSGEVDVFDGRVWPQSRRGANPTALEERKRIMRKIGMVFQAFNLFPHMNARDNITEAPRRALGIDRQTASARARDLLKKVGLEEFEMAWPAQMSGGQQQRVAIARALAMEPELLLLDEVTSALDPELVGEVLSVIRRIGQESDLTVLMVTHEMSFAARAVDRVLMFDAGRVIEDGPAAQVLKSPREERTKKFLSALLDR